MSVNNPGERVSAPSASSIDPPVGLPVDSLLPALREALRGSPNLVIEAAPGAGKTTRVPAMLLDAVPGEVLVLEPRRIAARLAARRVAEERGEPVGESVGYQVRYESVAGPRTRLRFVTEGVLTRRLLTDTELRGVDAVVLDEFHERHLDTDLALALLVRLQQRRPALHLLVMSATLDTGPVAAYLGNCPVFRSEGRTFPLQVRYSAFSALPLELKVREALAGLLREGEQGHVLIFLPGAAEIRRALRASEDLARGARLLLLPLYGELSAEEQDRALAPSERQKIIFATNVAESSVTIEGVTAVIDSGLARVASASPWTGLPTLEVRRISKASAQQRAGRAGRTAPGIAVRLYAPEDYAQRPAQEEPELLRSDLSGLCLTLRAMGFAGPGALRWLDAPPGAAVHYAEQLLDRLRADSEGARELARFPLPPRLGRMLLEAARRGVAPEGAAAAALLSTGARAGPVDLLDALDLPPEGAAVQQRRQLLRLLRGQRESSHDSQALLLALLAGFPDRVARRRGDNQVMLSTGVTAEFAGEPPPYDLMLVLDAEDRKDRPLPLVRRSARIEPEFLLDLFPERLREESRLEWNRHAQRVEVSSLLRYDDLTLDESRGTQPDPEAAAELLAEQVLDTGLAQFVDAEALEALKVRFGYAGLPEPDLPTEVRALCAGLRSFAEFREAATNLFPLLLQAGGAGLRDHAPESLQLAAGRRTRVHYEAGKPPWIASRLQDFFGMRDTPRIGRGHDPVVVHLLAPNGRAVQMTTDLAGFWERLYPTVRRELMRRYPRHAWPERP